LVALIGRDHPPHKVLYRLDADPRANTRTPRVRRSTFATRLVPMVSRRFLKFLIVGGAGFAVDAGVLTFALGHVTSSIYVARALSFSLAVLATWLLNRTFVFAASESGIAVEYARYFTIQVVAALTNLAIFVALIEAIPALSPTPVVPLAVGAILGALVNYAGSAWWVFRHRSA
jgi:putative flippase GtrA